MSHKKNVLYVSHTEQLLSLILSMLFITSLFVYAYKTRIKRKNKNYKILARIYLSHKDIRQAYIKYQTTSLLGAVSRLTLKTQIQCNLLTKIFKKLKVINFISHIYKFISFKIVRQFCSSGTLPVLVLFGYWVTFYTVLYTLFI